MSAAIISDDCAAIAGMVLYHPPVDARDVVRVSYAVIDQSANPEMNRPLFMLHRCAVCADFFDQLLALMRYVPNDTGPNHRAGTLATGRYCGIGTLVPDGREDRQKDTS